MIHALAASGRRPSNGIAGRYFEDIQLRQATLSTPWASFGPHSAVTVWYCRIIPTKKQKLFLCFV